MIPLKIAYENGTPGRDSYESLAVLLGSRSYDRLQQNWHSVSAYDGQALVGIGSVRLDGEYVASVDVAIHPAYRNRDIDQTIAKLLLAECKAHAITDITLSFEESAVDSPAGWPTVQQEGFQLLW